MQDDAIGETIATYSTPMVFLTSFLCFGAAAATVAAPWILSGDIGSFVSSNRWWFGWVLGVVIFSPAAVMMGCLNIFNFIKYGGVAIRTVGHSFVFIGPFVQRVNFSDLSGEVVCGENYFDIVRIGSRPIRVGTLPFREGADLVKSRIISRMGMIHHDW